MKSILFPSKRTASNLRLTGVLLGLCLVATLPARAQQDVPADHPLTLAECVNAALGKNPELEAIGFDLKAADSAVWSQRAALLPQLTASAQMFMLNGEPVSPFSILGVTEPELIARHVDWDTGWLASLGVTYPVFENGSFLGINNAPTVATARAIRKQQEWTRSIATESAIYTVAETYFSAISAQRKVGYYERMVALAKQRVSIIQSKAKLDLALTQDVQVAEARLAANEQGLRATQTRAKESNAYLAMLIGAAGPAQLNLAEPPPAPTVPPMEDLLEDIVAKHPQMGIQASNVDKARADVRLNQSHILPSVRLNASYSYGQDFNSSPAPDLVAASVVGEIPIFDFGRYYAAARESKNKLRAEEKRVELTRYDIRRTVLETANELHQQEEEAAALEEQVLKLQFESRAAKAKQEVGLFTPLSAVDAEVSLLQQQVLLQDARLKQWVKSAELQRAAGGVWKWIP